MHTAWAKNRRSWKPLCSRTSVTKLLLRKDGGMTCTTEVLKWTAVNSSEGIGKDGEAVDYAWLLERFWWSRA